MGATAAMVKKIRKTPVIYCLQDIFPDSLAGTGLAKKGGLLWKIGRVIENFTYRNADKIIVISEDFKRNIMAKGVPEEKIVVVYNWVDEEAVKHVEREHNKLFDAYALDRNRFYITYSGNIGLTQNMDMLLEVAKELEVNPDIHFVLIGEGAYKKRVEEIIAEKNISNVTLLPFQPYEDISHVFSLGDVGLVISKPGVGENSVPSKTWSILSASRPVLANFDENELKSIVAENQCGIFTKAGDKEAFKQSILRLYENRELCVEMGRNGREFIMKNLTRAVGTQKYVDVIKSFEKR
jgi:glycosyltransferase involved in cell wall biosynthesis